MGRHFYQKIIPRFYSRKLDLLQKRKGIVFVRLCNHEQSHPLVVQQKDGKLSDWVRDFKKFTSKKLLKMVLENPQESRKEWLKMIFEYQAKFNKRVGDMQFWTHEIEHVGKCHLWK